MARSDWLGIGAAAILTAVGFLFGGPVWGFALLFIGVVFVARAFLLGEESENAPELFLSASSERNPEVEELPPDLIFTTFSADVIPQIEKNAFLLHVRNDATSPLAVAKNVLAHIGYRKEDGHGIQVDYGAWMENAKVIDIGRGQTKRLIVALTEGGNNLAVNFTGPRTNFKSPELVPAGNLAAGQWMMLVKLNAENYEKKAYFLFTVEQTGAVNCRQIKQLLW